MKQNFFYYICLFFSKTNAFFASNAVAITFDFYVVKVTLGIEMMRCIV